MQCPGSLPWILSNYRIEFIWQLKHFFLAMLFPFGIHCEIQACRSFVAQAHRLPRFAVGKRSECPSMTIAKLLGELLCWLRLAFRLFTSWQTPFALFAKW